MAAQFSAWMFFRTQLIAIPAAATILNNAMMRICSSVADLGGVFENNEQAFKVVMSSTVDTILESIPQKWDEPSRIIETVHNSPDLREAVQDVESFHQLMELDVTLTKLDLLRLHLLFHIVANIGSHPCRIASAGSVIQSTYLDNFAKSIVQSLVTTYASLLEPSSSASKSPSSSSSARVLPSTTDCDLSNTLVSYKVFGSTNI